MATSVDEGAVASQPAARANLREQFWNLPNTITVLRTSVLPVLLLLPLFDGEFGSAVIAWAFIVAAVTDIVDGWLARRGQQVTHIGKLLDPLADKLLVAGMFITLAVIGLVPVGLAGVVIFRDIVIVGGAVTYNYLIKPVPGEPTRVSKLNTVLEMLFLLFVVSHAAFGWPDPISTTVLGAAILVTVVISGADYVWSWSRRARAGGVK